jgi:hypothetical protein
MNYDPAIVIVISLAANVALALGWFLSNRRLREQEKQNLRFGSDRRSAHS